jgi:hypothetical protein
MKSVLSQCTHTLVGRFQSVKIELSRYRFQCDHSSGVRLAYNDLHYSDMQEQPNSTVLFIRLAPPSSAICSQTPSVYVLPLM